MDGVFFDNDKDLPSNIDDGGDEGLHKTFPCRSTHYQDKDEGAFPVVAPDTWYTGNGKTFTAKDYRVDTDYDSCRERYRKRMIGNNTWKKGCKH